MRRVWLVARVALSLAVAAGAPACKKEKKAGGAGLKRSGDGAPVVLVDRTAPGGSNRVPEKEPNNEKDAATPLAIPATGVGTLDGQTDVDLYRLEPAADGFLKATLGGIEGVDLVLELRDAGGERLARSDRGPARVAEGIPDFEVKKGETYLLAVSEYVHRKHKKDPRTGASPPYELQVELSTGSEELHEKEPNESADGALEVLLGDQAFGYIGWAGDQDMWKLSLEGFSEGHSLDLSVEGVDGVALKLEVLDEGGKVLVTREGEKSGPVFVRNLVPITEQKQHFARLSAKRSNPLQLYVLTPKSRMLEDEEEREPNDEAEQATPLQSAPEEQLGTRRGYLTPGDRDYYRFEAGASATSLEIEVHPPPGVNAILEVRAGGVTHKADDGKDGHPEKLSGLAVGAGKTAWVRITGSSGAAEPERYELRWSAQAAPSDEPPDEGDFDDFDDF